MNPGVQYVNPQPQIYNYDYYKDDKPDEKPVELLLFIVAIGVAFVIIYGRDENGKMSGNKLSKSISDSYTGVDQQEDEFGRKKNVDSMGKWMEANPLPVVIIAFAFMGMAYNYYRKRSIFTIPFGFYMVAVIAAILMGFFQNKLGYIFLGIIIFAVFIFIYRSIRSYFKSGNLKKRVESNKKSKPKEHLNNIKLTAKEYIMEGEHQAHGRSFIGLSRLSAIYDQVASYVKFHSNDVEKMEELSKTLLGINRETGKGVATTKTVDAVARKHHIFNYITSNKGMAGVKRIGGIFDWFGPTKAGERWYGYLNDGEKYLDVKALRKI